MESAALSRAFSFSGTFGGSAKMNPSGGRRSLNTAVSPSSPAQAQARNDSPSAAERPARRLGTDASPPGPAGPGFCSDGHQPGVGTGASVFDQIPDRQRHRQTSRRIVAAPGLSRTGGHLHSGDHVIRADSTVIESGAAPDRGTSPESAGAHFASAGRVLRFQQDRHAGLAHHDRRGRSAEPVGDRTGRSGRRAAYLGHRHGRALSHQSGHDHPGIQLPALLRHRPE